MCVSLTPLRWFYLAGRAPRPSVLRSTLDSAPVLRSPAPNSFARPSPRPPTFARSCLPRVLACFTYTSISSCDAAKASGFGCQWCYADAYCSEGVAPCDEGCINGPIYMTCAEFGGMIALASATAIVLLAIGIFAWNRQKQLDLVGLSDVYVPGTSTKNEGGGGFRGRRLRAYMGVKGVQERRRGEKEHEEGYEG